jgi:hypothetical protein
VAHIVSPGSVLARTAAELLDRHDTGADGCTGCGPPAPRPAATHARQVLATPVADLVTPQVAPPVMRAPAAVESSTTP